VNWVRPIESATIYVHLVSIRGQPIMAAYFDIRFLTGAIISCVLGACASDSRLAGQNADEFCTVENGYQQGSEGAAYTNVCPDVLAPAFLEGYQSGYAVHLGQMEVEAMERAIETLSKDLEDVYAALDAATDAEIPQLSVRRGSLTAQLDELESEVALRKTQLSQMRHSIAAND
jgi:hypothetical protein